MITTNLANAQILILLVSDDESELRQLTADLRRSSYRYCVESPSDKSALVDSVKRQIDSNGGRLPVVLLINYQFAGKDCINLLQLAHQASQTMAIESIVTQPPLLQSRRRAMRALGARLFDDENSLAVGHGAPN